MAGGIAGAALVEGLLPLGVGSSITSLEPGVNKAQGLFIEAFLTAMLVFTVLMMGECRHYVPASKRFLIFKSFSGRKAQGYVSCSRGHRVDIVRLSAAGNLMDW